MAAVPKREQIAEGDSSASFLNGLPVRLKDDEFYNATEEHERRALRFELNCALQIFLELDRPVFLDGLGLFLPRIGERSIAYISGESLVIRKEKVRSLVFEKTDDLHGSPLLRESNRVVELHELASRIYARLPVSMHLKWSSQGMRSLLRARFASVREKLLRQGFSQHLSALGTLYALHNRLGDNVKDWYAGADIMLQPRRAQILEVLESRLFDRPVFESAWEPLRALFGTELDLIRLNFREELNNMGIDHAEIPDSRIVQDEIRVAVFLDREAVKPRLIYCTEGLRSLAYQVSESSVGCELATQLPYGSDSAFDQKPAARTNKGALRLLALGLAMMLGTKGKSLRVGLGADSEGAILEDQKTVITGIVSNHISPLNGLHLSSQGEFAYANLVGISNSEAKLISAGKRLHLLSLLELKGLGQVTHFKRPCLMQHSCLE